MKSCAPMNERIHAYDSKILLQLTGGFGRVAIPHLMKNAIAPSLQENIWDPSSYINDVEQYATDYDFELFMKDKKR